MCVSHHVSSGQTGIGLTWAPGSASEPSHRLSATLVLPRRLDGPERAWARSSKSLNEKTPGLRGSCLLSIYAASFRLEASAAAVAAWHQMVDAAWYREEAACSTSRGSGYCRTDSVESAGITSAVTRNLSGRWVLPGVTLCRLAQPGRSAGSSGYSAGSTITPVLQDEAARWVSGGRKDIGLWSRVW